VVRPVSDVRRAVICWHGIFLFAAGDPAAAVWLAAGLGVLLVLELHAAISSAAPRPSTAAPSLASRKIL
jgi:hypothetical protein